MSTIERVFEQYLAETVATVLDMDYMTGKTPADSTLASCETVVDFGVRDQGRVGHFLIFFTRRHRDTLRKRFVQMTLGPDHSPGAPDDDCREIANLVFGRFVGRASDEGLDLEVEDAGAVLTGEEARARYLTGGGTFLTVEPSDKTNGAMTVCLHFDEPAAEASVEPKEEAMDSAPTSAKARVLVVDDSPVMRAFLEQILLDNGYDVVGKASDGLEAIEKYNDTHPDLMTLDIIMPKMKGTEVLEKVLEDHPDAKVIMASSVSDARTVMKCLRVGAKRYIVKPYSGKAVIEAVEKTLAVSSDATA